MVMVKIIGGAASQMRGFAMGWHVARALGEEKPMLDVSDYTSGYKFPYILDLFPIDCRKLAFVHASLETLHSQAVPQGFWEQYSPAFIECQGKRLEAVIQEALAASAPNIYLIGESCSCTEQQMRALGDIFWGVDDPFLRCFENMIRDRISVGVHVRRTDFLLLEWEDSYSYYRDAIQAMREKFPEAEFFFFSDDLQDVHNNLEDDCHFHYVSLPGGYATDVTEMFCLALCDYRIGSRQSGYSTMADFLSAMPEKTEKDLSGEDLSEKEESETEPGEKIYRGCFDWGNISSARLEELYSGYEDMLLEKGAWVFLKQAALRHLEFAPGSVAANYHMAVANYELGRKMASYLYAARLCRETANQELTQMFMEYYENDEQVFFFQELLQLPQIHFIICPVTIPNYYTRQSISAAIILKHLGCEVTVICGQDGTLNAPKDIPEEIRLEFMMSKKIDLGKVHSYDHHIVVYAYGSVNGVSICEKMADKIAAEKGLPIVIVGRLPFSIVPVSRYPRIYWDFSEGKDADSLAMRMYADWEEEDRQMKQSADRIITTDASVEALYPEKALLVEKYMDEREYWYEEGAVLGANYVDRDDMVRFAVELARLGAELVRGKREMEGI